ISRQMAVHSVADRAPAYGFGGVSVDGNDVLACFEAMSTAVDRARNGGGPTLIECNTYRFHPHTSDDDDRTYRTREEVEQAKARDPIALFGNQLEELGLIDADGIETLRAEIKASIDADAERAWTAPDPAPDTVLDHLFADSGAGRDADLGTTGGEAVPGESPSDPSDPSDPEAAR
ncbi:MAG TPA: thiamine pyrophosphate-dependent enzyme, partial [Actinomycetota bacterium]|nr:thiamine pyrophosphate-dependent enzyme [Actinomycetota bacterium]